ncbi:MAG TPA: helix-hairpin-helix domain-containing protein [Verrucomicrobiae bacterium]|nr:helix-hairpin-helix domain-containing protein [Verrucomicrobiae bacterium]
MDRKQLLLAALLLGAILVGTGYKLALAKMKSESKPVVTVNQGKQEKKDTTRQVTVYITGAVRKPGVYTFLEGARIIDAVKKAELAHDAAAEYVNLAELMTDSQHIYVPRKSEVTESGQTQGAEKGYSTTGNIGRTGKMNINTATKETLDGLPGVGPSTAEKIVEYRQTHGKFKSVSDLLNVTGIGEKKLAKFKDKITI